MSIPDLGSLVASESKIRFITKRISDPTEWVGTIIAANVNWKIAIEHSDIEAYNNATRQSDPSISNDYKTLNYFIIEVDNGEESASVSSKKYAFAVEWINQDTFKVCTNLLKRELIVYVENDLEVDDIINILRSANVNCVKAMTNNV